MKSQGKEMQFPEMVGDEQDDLKNLALLKVKLEFEIDKVRGENTMKKSTNTINSYGDATNVQLQQGTINSSQTQQVQSGVDFEEAQKVIEKIYSYQTMFAQEFGSQSQELEQALGEAVVAIEEKKPTHLKKAWGTIKSLAEGTTGSLIASGIVELLKKVPL